MHPLPIVSFIIAAFLLCFFSLVGLIFADWLVELRLSLPKQDSLQLNLESLIGELTIYA